MVRSIALLIARHPCQRQEHGHPRDSLRLGREAGVTFGNPCKKKRWATKFRIFFRLKKKSQSINSFMRIAGVFLFGKKSQPISSFIIEI
jgi:hypothetical protein